MEVPQEKKKQNLKRELQYDRVIPFLGIYAKERKVLDSYLHSCVPSSSIPNTQEMEAT